MIEQPQPCPTLWERERAISTLVRGLLHDYKEQLAATGRYEAHLLRRVEAAEQLAANLLGIGLTSVSFDDNLPF